MTDKPSTDDSRDPIGRIINDSNQTDEPIPVDELPDDDANERDIRTVDETTDDDPDGDHLASDPRTTIDGTERRADSTGGFGRRGFLKKAAVAVIAGATSVATTDRASASQADRHINVSGIRESSYEIHMGGIDNNIYSGDRAGPNDSINDDHDKVDGYVNYQNFDSYRHDGNIHFIRVDGNVAFYFTPGWEPANHNEIIVTGEGSGHHEYYLEADGELNLGNKASPDNDRDKGSYVLGNVWNNNTDTYTHTGPITQVRIDGQVRVLLI
jgi:hypothetical protein